ncbi:MAG: CoA pyrophosphatase [Chloroflexi bacterium]|nr:CoA pyrophosphatase [Chloroflexota bacterium]
MTTLEYILAICAVLQQPLPGLTAQQSMCPHSRKAALPWPEDARQGAVLVLLYPHKGDVLLSLTKRTEKVEHHKGQISLPGGEREPADADVWATALREAHEEVGVIPDRVNLCGALSPLYITSSRFMVQPYVGWMSERPAYVLNEEVESLFELPLSALLDDAIKKQTERILDGQRTSVPCYSYATCDIWGATAMILAEFEAVVSCAATPNC